MTVVAIGWILCTENFSKGAENPQELGIFTFNTPTVFSKDRFFPVVSSYVLWLHFKKINFWLLGQYFMAINL